MELVKPASEEEFPYWLSNFIDIYQKLATDNLELLHDIYSPEVIFQDPMHSISGFDNLSAYFHELYTNVKSCRFIVNDVIYQEETAAIYWTMTYQHPKLNKGKEVVVHGHSKLKGKNDFVYYHRDYLDLGAMLYEHIPLLGRVVKHIKQRVNA